MIIRILRLLAITLALTSTSAWGQFGSFGSIYWTMYTGICQVCMGITPVANGTTSSMNYDWGSNGILGTFYNNNVSVGFTTQVTVPGSGAKYVQFSATSADGVYMQISGNGVAAVAFNNWTDCITTCAKDTRTVTGAGMWLQGGLRYDIVISYYQRNAPGYLTVWWTIDGNTAVFPATPVAPPPPPPPTYCCGAVDTSFNKTATQTVLLSTWLARTTLDRLVYIDQVGNSSTITLEQTGSKNNYFNYTGRGSGNTVNVTQSTTVSTAANYIDLDVLGNTNTVSMSQSSSGGTKSAFVVVSGNNNGFTLIQNGSGDHYADVTLGGGNKTVSLTQSGSAAHNASITLTGYAVSLSLSQSGAISNYYSINYNCATVGGCAAITVTQTK